MAENLWDRWRRIDAVTWHGQPTESQAFEAWYECHRHLVSDRKPEECRAAARAIYTNCRDIKAFHQTVTGQKLHAIYVFNTRLLKFLQHPDRPIRRWLWFSSWLYRQFLVDIGYVKSTLETELERSQRREDLARDRDAAARQQFEDWFNAPPPDVNSNPLVRAEVIEAEFTNESDL